jgi:hypothetical protein
MKKYQHATKNELDTLLFRAGEFKRKSKQFIEIHDIDGNLVDPSKITRTNELTGAGLEYLTSLGEYLFTHHKKKIDDKDQHYFSVTLDWNAAIDIAVGGITGQRKRAEVAIMHWHAKPKPTLIIAPDGQRYSMLPFVIVFNWGRPEELDAKVAAKLAHLNKDDNQELFPIKSITIKLARPLFEDFFRRGAGTYSFPVGMYAKMFKEANNIKRILEKENIDTELQKRLQSFSDDIYLSAYTRFARYIMRHHNLTSKQIKDKTHYCTLDILIIPFLLEVYPKLVEEKGEGKLYVDLKKFHQFLGNAIGLYLSISNFLLYPILERMSEIDFTLGIHTNQETAIQVGRDLKKKRIEQINKNMEIKKYKNEHPTMSNRKIAEIFKVNEITVRRALHQIILGQ